MDPVTRRRLGVLAACAAVASGVDRGLAQNLPSPAFPKGTIAKIWPGQLFSMEDHWTEFFVDNGPGNPSWHEAVEPAFIEVPAAGQDLTKLPVADAKRLFQWNPSEMNDADIKAILSAKGGPVLQAYQNLLKAMKDNPLDRSRQNLLPDAKWK